MGHFEQGLLFCEENISNWLVLRGIHFKQVPDDFEQGSKGAAESFDHLL